MPYPYEVVTALFEQVKNHPALSGVTVLKNTTELQELDDALEDGDALIVIRDGDPGEGEGVLGGFRAKYYSHVIDVEEYVRAESDDARDLKLHDLHRKLVIALESDITLGGLVQAMEYDEPPGEIEAIEGATDIKSALTGIAVDYQSGPSA